MEGFDKESFCRDVVPPKDVWLVGVEGDERTDHQTRYSVIEIEWHKNKSRLKCA